MYCTCSADERRKKRLLVSRLDLLRRLSNYGFAQYTSALVLLWCHQRGDREDLFPQSHVVLLLFRTHVVVRRRINMRREPARAFWAFALSLSLTVCPSSYVHIVRNEKERWPITAFFHCPFAVVVAQWDVRHKRERSLVNSSLRFVVTHEQIDSLGVLMVVAESFFLSLHL